jgi:hypothetical protein
MFNKYQWTLEEEKQLREFIIESVKNNHSVDESDLAEQLNNDIDNAVIYYRDCFDIIKDCNFTDFTESDFEISNISQAAFAALYEFAYGEINLDELLRETLEDIENGWA